MIPFLYFISFVMFIFLVLFLPFDWWQKPPARQRDRLIGKLLPFLGISLRNIVLRTLFLVFFVIAYFHMIIFLPVLAAIVIGWMVIWSLHERICLHKRTPAVPVLGVTIIVVLASIFIIGLSAPLRTIPIAGYLALGRPAGNSWEALTIGKDWIRIDGIIGLCGIFGVASWMLLDAVWRFRQYRQVRDIATSRTGALALGLVEVKGTVRPLTGSGDGTAVEITYGLSDAFQPRQRIELFFLDDGTGRVIVDATSCRVRAGWIAELSAIFGVREIVLRRRKLRDEFSDSLTRTLHYGDRIYLIGNAEREEGGDIVIRPASRAGWNEVLWKTLFGAIRPPKGRSIHDIFFLTDGDESVARRHILKGFRTVLFYGLIWITASMTIIWTSQQPWRHQPPPDSWRNAYWRGPEPNPDQRVLDYTRNQRLFRYEKYIKTLGPESYDQIPALIEALQYKDSRFRRAAASALIPMMPAARQQAGEAVPILARHLKNSSGTSLQTYIVALQSFGPLAEPAVPALIQQLSNRGPFSTYEVTPAIIRWQAARALGDIGGGAEEALPALTETLNDPSRAVRDAAAEAIRKIRWGMTAEEDWDN